MPRGWLGGARLLDQHMIMKNLYAPGLHQISGNFRSRGLSDDLFKLRNAGPIAIIIKETPILACFQVFSSIRAGLLHIHLDAIANGLDMVGEQSFDQDNAIALKSINMGLGNQWVHMGLLLLPPDLKVSFRDFQERILIRKVCNFSGTHCKSHYQPFPNASPFDPFHDGWDAGGEGLAQDF